MLQTKRKPNAHNIRVRIVCNGQKSVLKQCINKHIVQRKKRNSKPSCEHGIFTEKVGVSRTTAGGYFRADRKLKQLNEQKERAKNKEKNSKRLADTRNKLAKNVQVLHKK